MKHQTYLVYELVQESIPNLSATNPTCNYSNVKYSSMWYSTRYI